MPEGPEIRRIADALEKQILGRCIDHIHFGLNELKSWEQRIVGSRILAIKTFGKAIVIKLDNGLHIYSHNQLYGRWELCDSNNYPQTWREFRER